MEAIKELKISETDTLDFVIAVSLQTVLEKNEDELLDYLEEQICESPLPRISYSYKLVGCDSELDILFFRVEIDVDLEEFMYLEELMYHV